MDSYWKAIAFVLMGLILWMVLDKQEKDLSVLLTLAVCCAVGAVCVRYLEPMVDLLWQLNTIGQLQDGVMQVLLKTAGIGMIAELAGMVCTDAGNGALAKMIRLLESAVILYLSIPILQMMITTVQEILCIV